MYINGNFSFRLSPRLNIDRRITKIGTTDHYHEYNTGLKFPLSIQDGRQKSKMAATKLSLFYIFASWFLECVRLKEQKNLIGMSWNCRKKSDQSNTFWVSYGPLKYVYEWSKMCFSWIAPKYWLLNTTQRTQKNLIGMFWTGRNKTLFNRTIFEWVTAPWNMYINGNFSFRLSPRLNIDRRITKIGTNDRYHE